MEFKDTTSHILESQLDDLKNQVKQLSNLTRRVAILEAVAVAEAPESLQAVQTIYNAASITGNREQYDLNQAHNEKLFSKAVKEKALEVLGENFAKGIAWLHDKADKPTPESKALSLSIAAFPHKQGLTDREALRPAEYNAYEAGYRAASGGKPSPEHLAAISE
ncbi:hypothetical protein BSY48_004414 [Salmonella enterica subsp. enterica serovar Agbeni]|nr:hypothetical protein [Salmonella enterica subsp. enterica serovar Agbeni]